MPEFEVTIWRLRQEFLTVRVHADDEAGAEKHAEVAHGCGLYDGFGFVWESGEVLEIGEEDETGYVSPSFRTQEAVED